MGINHQLPKQVSIVEVGPRDGLQNEKQWVDTPVKLELIQRLIDSGCQEIEATAFVSPKWVPQMADALDLLRKLQAQSLPKPRYAVLVPNMQGLERALSAGCDEIVIFTAASESFAQKNINCSITESIARFESVVELAHASGVAVRASISCCLGCPYEGAITPAQVISVLRQLLDLGCDSVDIADTIGVGTAVRVQEVFAAVSQLMSLDRVAGHFHDTYGQALTNIFASLQMGVSTFHASVAGLGGCPYARGASGNVATEDVVYLMQGLGIDTGIDLNTLAQTGQWISAQLGRSYGSRAGQAIYSKQMSCE